MPYRTDSSLIQLLLLALLFVFVVSVALGAIAGGLELVNPIKARMAEEAQRAAIRQAEEERRSELLHQQAMQQEELAHRREMNQVKRQLYLALGYASGLGLVTLATGYAAKLVVDSYWDGRARAQEAAEAREHEMARREARRREQMERQAHLAQAAALVPVPMPSLSRRNNGPSAVTTPVSAND
jgi:hypothetical protein